MDGLKIDKLLVSAEVPSRPAVVSGAGD
jgi:hypothetical protein